MDADSQSSRLVRCKTDAASAGASTKGLTAVDRAWLRTLSEVVADKKVFPPRPDVELARRKAVLQARAWLETSVQDLMPTAQVPRESFNRWILTRANRHGAAWSAAADPIFGEEVKRGSALLAEELLKAIPVQLPYAEADDVEAARNNLVSYIDSLLPCLGASDSGDLAAECRSAKAWALSSIKDEDSKTASEASGRLSSLQNKAHSVLRQLFATRVEALVTDLGARCDSAAEGLKRLQSSEVQQLSVAASLDVKRHAYIFSLDSADGDRDEVGEAASLGDGFVLSIGRLDKLAKALRSSSRRLEATLRSETLDDHLQAALSFMQAGETLWQLAFCMLCRLDALCGPRMNEGGGMHAAVPARVFDAFLEGEEEDTAKKRVAVESFASPLLCHGGRWRFCSLFPDLDVFFGSLGTFFSPAVVPDVLGGCFEANPPFVHGVVEPMVDKILMSLERAEETEVALQFIMVVPHGRGIAASTSAGCSDGEEDALQRLLNSRFTAGASDGGKYAFTFGLSFRTDHTWPAFNAGARVIILRTGAFKAAARESAETLLHRTLQLWGAGESASVPDSGS